jgi:hypothetical protein
MTRDRQHRLFPIDRRLEPFLNYAVRMNNRGISAEQLRMKVLDNIAFWSAAFAARGGINPDLAAALRETAIGALAEDASAWSDGFVAPLLAAIASQRAITYTQYEQQIGEVAKVSAWLLDNLHGDEVKGLRVYAELGFEHDGEYASARRCAVAMRQESLTHGLDAIIEISDLLSYNVN